ncbi:hypothetical protein EXS72_02635 [Candidatus Pacearchaeota archaeon]|nr:hypothetical protein [Candidatus Pacearchaeota archaeon]
MELVAFLGEDKETWGQVTGLINHGDWDKIILVKSKSSDDYDSQKTVETIIVDTSKPLLDLKEEIINKLRKTFQGFDVNVSIASGNGKEHMALISALLSIPVGIRLVVFTKNGVEFIN